VGIRRALQSRRQRHADLILAILAAREAGRFGADMWRLSGVPSGAMYVALAHLEREGLVTSGWAEDHAGRRRRLYRITPAGRLAAARG
jgi:DNA-binding PadR family transcriptional regulator